ncbi:hypothetical protein J6590_042148 [Homalodisca vitripennis]|nr:hypothetical protein J6590_042148 [Homalodisca vitripennis]
MKPLTVWLAVVRGQHNGSSHHILANAKAGVVSHLARRGDGTRSSLRECWVRVGNPVMRKRSTRRSVKYGRNKHAAWPCTIKCSRRDLCSSGKTELLLASTPLDPVRNSLSSIHEQHIALSVIYALLVEYSYYIGTTSSLHTT